MPTYATNKKAYADYHILETKEAGMMLSGAEVKSIRNGQINLRGSYLSFPGGNKALLINAHISPYPFAKGQGTASYSPTQPRKLLLNKKEIAYLQAKSEEKGLTTVPLSVYTKGQYIKVSIAVVKGKKQYDKRDDLKKRAIVRDSQREIKRSQYR